MKKLLLYSLALLVMVACSPSEDINNDYIEEEEKEEEPIVQPLPDNVSEAYVNIDYNEASVSECDTTRGVYVLNFRDRVPSIKPGNVLTVQTDTLSVIALVTQATKNGKTVTLQAQMGDLSYVFFDTDFELDPSETTRANLPPFARAQYKSTLWNQHINITNDIYKNDFLRMWTESSMDAKIGITLNFSFRGKVNTLINAINFVRSKKFDVSCTLSGSWDASYDLFVHAEGKGVFPPKDERIKPLLLKRDVMPPVKTHLVVSGIPIPITLGCDLYADASFSGEGKADLTTGVSAHVDGSVGLTYDGTSGKGIQPSTSLNTSYEFRDPKISGEGTLESKVHVYPRFYARILGLAGPCIDIKPYLKSVAEGGFNLSLLNRQDEYIAANLRLYAGVDAALGVSWSEKFSDNDKNTSDLNIGEVQLYESPIEIKMEAAYDEGPLSFVTFGIYDKLLNGTSVLSKLKPVVKLETYDYDGNYVADGGVPRYACPGIDGYLPVNWTPKNGSCVLVAKVFNKDGSVKAQATYSRLDLLICPDNNHPHAIDLGLPSGNRWCCCNVGANTPIDYGSLFAWAETTTKREYTPENYMYWKDKNHNGYPNIGEYTTPQEIAGTEYDAAHVIMGGSWRMPSVAQARELIDNCSTEFVTINGIDGEILYGRNGRAIFFPAGGYGQRGGWTGPGLGGYFWASELNPKYECYGCSFGFVHHSNTHPKCWGTGNQNYREAGLNVRAMIPLK